MAPFVRMALVGAIFKLWQGVGNIPAAAALGGGAVGGGDHLHFHLFPYRHLTDPGVDEQNHSLGYEPAGVRFLRFRCQKK